MKKILLFFSLSFCLLSCAEDIGNQPLDFNALFNCPEVIDVPPFAYFDSDKGRVYNLKADESLNRLIIDLSQNISFDDLIKSIKVDTVGKNPSLSWEYTGNVLVSALISSKRIIIDQDNTIVNKTDIVWIWNSGMNSGVDGEVTFADGRSYDFSNGGFINDLPPTPLESNKVYFWVVWAWDDSGIIITKSSRELFFFVD